MIYSLEFLQVYGQSGTPKSLLPIIWQWAHLSAHQLHTEVGSNDQVHTLLRLSAAHSHLEMTTFQYLKFLFGCLIRINYIEHLEHFMCTLTSWISCDWTVNVTTEDLHYTGHRSDRRRKQKHVRGAGGHHHQCKEPAPGVGTGELQRGDRRKHRQGHAHSRTCTTLLKLLMCVMSWESSV